MVVAQPDLVAAVAEPVVASRAEAAAVRRHSDLVAAAVVPERLEAAASLRAEPAWPIPSILSILVTKCCASSLVDRAADIPAFPVVAKAAPLPDLVDRAESEALVALRVPLPGTAERAAVVRVAERLLRQAARPSE